MIDKYLFNESSYKKYYFERLLQNYDKKDKMFYFDKSTENISRKIAATNIALQIYDLIGEMPSYIIQDIKNVNLKLICNDKYFSYSDIDAKRNIFNEGLVIIDNLRILDKYCEDDLKHTVSTRKSWIIYWYDWFNIYLDNQKVYSPVGNIGISSFKKVYEYLGLEYDFSNSYINILNEDCLRKTLFSDVQMTRDSIFVYQIYKKEIPDEIYRLLKMNIKYWYYETYPPSVYIKDLFYGIQLSNKVGFTYNKNKIIAFTNNYMLHNNITIFDAYYINASNTILGYANPDFDVKLKEVVYNTLKENESLYGGPNTIKAVFYALCIDKQNKYGYINNCKLKSLLNKKFFESQLLTISDDQELYYDLK